MYWYIIFHGNDTIHSDYFKTFYECKRDALLHCFCYNGEQISISIFKYEAIIQDIDVYCSDRKDQRNWSY